MTWLFKTVRLMKMTCALAIITTIALGANECSRPHEQSCYLIPDRFFGNVVVIFNQQDGVQEEFNKGSRIYRIPSSGILKTKFKAIYGLHQPDMFYYVGQKGNKIRKLYYFNTTKEIDSQINLDDTVCLNAVPFKSINKKTDCITFIVGNKIKSDSLYEKRSTFMLNIQ